MELCVNVAHLYKPKKFPIIWDLLKCNFIYLFLAVLGLCGCRGFSLAVTSEGRSPVAVLGLLTAVAPPVVEHGP